MESTQRLINTVRRSALPKMQGVVSDLRRLVTSMRHNKNKRSSRFNVDMKQGALDRLAGSSMDEEDEGAKTRKLGGRSTAVI